MRIFISAGEPSGDLHAANLIRSLRGAPARTPSSSASAAPKMAEAGGELLYPLVDLAVMWFLRVLLNLAHVLPADRPGRPLFPRRAARRRRPDRLSGLPLVDRPAGQGAGHPGLLLRPAADLGLGRLAGQEGAEVRRPRPVQPAVRAGLVSRAGRAGCRLRRPSLLRRAGRAAARRRRSSPSSAAGPGPLVAILPGSRTQEVTRNLPIMLRAAARAGAARGPTSGSPSPACTSGTRRWPSGSSPSRAQGGPPAVPTIEVHRRADARADPAGRRRLGRLGLGRAGADGRGAADGRPLQGQAVRPLGRPAVHQGEVHQPGQPPGRRRGHARVPDLARRLGRPGRWAAAWLDDPEERAADDVRPGRAAAAGRPPGASDRAAERIVARLSRRGEPAPSLAYRGPHDPARASRRPASGQPHR